MATALWSLHVLANTLSRQAAAAALPGTGFSALHCGSNLSDLESAYERRRSADCRSTFCSCLPHLLMASPAKFGGW